MVVQRLLVSFLLTSTLHWIEVLGENKNDTHSPRVVGGNIVTNRELGGYIVAMRYDGSFACGGTLVQDLIVLTAAHCFEQRRIKEKWLISGGVSMLNEIGVSRRIRKIIIPKAFSMDTMEMDVAVVLMDRPMVGNGIGKLSLCDKPLEVGRSLTVAGFGMVKSGGTNPGQYLRQTTVPIDSKEYCRKAYRKIIAITNSMLCASEKGKRDACTYDSGGPLVYKNQVCGIVSFGIGCASSRYPGVYTDVTYAKSFITKIINMLMSQT
ncbi:hypothetical protein KR059_002678 [Drosophila kikkawai]|nr:hypothetical protein KR059_002678 [Drosophila kikkawai]